MPLRGITKTEKTKSSLNFSDSILSKRSSSKVGKYPYENSKCHTIPPHLSQGSAVNLFEAATNLLVIS